MLRIGVGLEGRRAIHGADAKEAIGVHVVLGCCISHVKISIFTKAYLDFNEKKQEISLIRAKEKTHRNNISVCFNRKAGNVFWDSSKMPAQ